MPIECMTFTFAVSAKNGATIGVRGVERKKYGNCVIQPNAKVKSATIRNDWHDYRILDNNQEVYGWLARDGLRLGCRLLSFLNITRGGAKLCDDIVRSHRPVVDDTIKGSKLYTNFWGTLFYDVSRGFEVGMDQMRRERRNPHTIFNLNMRTIPAYLVEPIVQVPAASPDQVQIIMKANTENPVEWFYGRHAVLFASQGVPGAGTPECIWDHRCTTDPLSLSQKTPAVQAGLGGQLFAYGMGTDPHDAAQRLLDISETAVIKMKIEVADLDQPNYERPRDTHMDEYRAFKCVHCCAYGIVRDVVGRTNDKSSYSCRNCSRNYLPFIVVKKCAHKRCKRNARRCSAYCCARWEETNCQVHCNSCHAKDDLYTMCGGGKVPGNWRNDVMFSDYGPGPYE